MPKRKRRKKQKSNKGVLIKGMSKVLPIELLRDPAFEEGLNEMMRGYAGVYALYKNKELYYVGLATNSQENGVRLQLTRASDDIKGEGYE